MATLKHIASKSADYAKPIEYLMFEHNDNGTPVRNEEGNMLMRSKFILEGINCTPYSFDLECRMLNEKYHKNRKFSDIKSHHYILSFDPRDGEEGRLTCEHAQELGMEFARKCFPGHQVLVCTHDDGHNKSGNIHVHMILNSLRKLDVEKQPFMEREIDSRAGYKHNLTLRYLQFLQAEVMRICEREGLHQVDLLTPAERRIRDGEYRAQQRGQEKLDELNQQIIAGNMTPAQTVFQTQKQYLRDSIQSAAERAFSPEEFQRILKDDFGIELKERRGRFSYLHPERQKYITGRALGSAFEKEVVLKQILEKDLESRKNEEKADRLDDWSEDPLKKSSKDLSGDQHEILPEEQSGNTPDIHLGDERPITEYDPSYDYQADPVAILYVRSSLRLVVELQTRIREQHGEAYAQDMKLTSLKEMARTVVFAQQYGYDSYEELVRDRKYYAARIADSAADLQDTKEELRKVNERIHFAGQYYANRSAQSDFLKSWNKKKFRMTHRDELDRYHEAVDYFKEHNEGTIPSMKDLRRQKEDVTALRSQQEKDLQSMRKFEKDLQTAASNIDAILGYETIPARKKRSREPEL